MPGGDGGTVEEKWKQVSKQILLHLSVKFITQCLAPRHKPPVALLASHKTTLGSNLSDISCN